MTGIATYLYISTCCVLGPNILSKAKLYFVSYTFDILLNTFIVISLLVNVTHSAPLLAIYILLIGLSLQTTLIESFDIIQKIRNINI